MPELRYDPIRPRWTVISTERNLRPQDYLRKRQEPSSTNKCPFCYGHEDMTPPEVYAIADEGREPNTPGWRVRVVPNKYPALRIEGELLREGVGIFDVTTGIGAHEVIIETPDHNRHLDSLTDKEMFEYLFAVRERMFDLRKDDRFRYIIFFRNHGAEAGASLSHPHSQLIATPIIPPVVVSELKCAKNHFHMKERCIFCDLIKQELLLVDRVVEDHSDYLVWEPFASSFPFETWLLPKKHLHDFTKLTDDELFVLGQVLRNTLHRLSLGLNDPPYNMILHTAPTPHPRPARRNYWDTIEYDYHWHIEIVPRMTHIAGFEWGAGLNINPTPPEEAAKYLRNVKIE